MYKADNVVTARPASTSLLTVDSEDRFGNYIEEQLVTSTTSDKASPYDFVINKPESMMNGFLTRLAVTEIVFPWVIPNINGNTNKIIINAYSGATGSYSLLTSSTITLTTGFRSPSVLAADLQAAIRLADTNLAAFTLTYGGANNPIFSYAVGASTATAVNIVPIITADPLRKQLFDILGFSTANTTVKPSGSGKATLCQYTRYIDIVCPQLTYNQPLKDTSTQFIVRDALCRVYLDQVSGSFNANKAISSDATFIPTGCEPFVIYHNYPHPKQINWTPNQPIPGQLRFQVYDDAGVLLSAANTAYADGTNWSMSLLVTEN